MLGGIALFFADELAPGHLAGNLVALGAGIAFAFSTMTLRRVALDHTDDRPVDPLRPVLLGNLLAAVLGAPFLFLHAPPGPEGWAALVALGVVQQGAAYLAFTWAIRHATALEAMLIPIVEPIFSPLWVALAVGEIPGPWSLLGGAIVIGSVSLRAALARAPAA